MKLLGSFSDLLGGRRSKQRGVALWRDMLEVGKLLVRERIKFLDGLRGLAILAVLFFHAYVSDPAHLPFGDRYTFIPIRLGWVGVQLFFLISGYVILMTLTNCATISEFAKRRWWRLFPAMLIASVIILLFDIAVGVGPYNQRTWINLLPGLLFVSPSIIHTLTGKVIDSMDVTFWSLYVEVCFYVIFGSAYFLLGSTMAIVGVFFIFGLTYFAELIASGGDLFSRSAAAADWLGFTHFGWFASGAVFYRFSKDRSLVLFVLAVAAGVISALTSKFPAPEKMSLLFVVILFASAVVSLNIQRLLSSRILLFFGFISYPLYLVHNNILIGLLNITASKIPSIPLILIPIFPLLAVIFVAWTIAKFGEPAFRSLRGNTTKIRFRKNADAGSD